MACDCKINHVNYKEEKIEAEIVEKPVEVVKEEPKVIEEPEVVKEKPKVTRKRKPRFIN